MEKISESTSFKISDFIFRFRESSQRFVVEILTQNFAFNLSGTLFFIGLGCSLKWWYKDQLLITLLKQNLPAFSQPQQKISWETGEYLIGEQTRQFIREKPNFSSGTAPYTCGTWGASLRKDLNSNSLCELRPRIASNSPSELELNPILFNPKAPRMGSDEIYSFADLIKGGSPLGGLKTKLLSDQVSALPLKMGNQNANKMYEKAAVRGSEAGCIENEAIKEKALSDHAHVTSLMLQTDAQCTPSKMEEGAKVQVKKRITSAMNQSVGVHTRAPKVHVQGGTKKNNEIDIYTREGLRRCIQEVGLLNSEIEGIFTPQVRNLSPCSFNDLIDRLDVYSNSVVINFKSPWQKHAYHRFMGIFPELICADTAHGLHSLPSNSQKEMQGTENRGPQVKIASALTEKATLSSSSLSTKVVHSVFQKYTFWGPPKNWFKLSARGLCILNDASPLTSFLHFDVQHKPTLRRFTTFFKKPLIQTLEFPFNEVCEIPEKNIVVASYGSSLAPKVHVLHSPSEFDGKPELVSASSSSIFDGDQRCTHVVGEKEDASAEHYFAPLVVNRGCKTQLASSMHDKARTLLSIEKVKPLIKKTRAGTSLHHSRILNKGLAELSVIVNNVDGINFPTTKTSIKDNLTASLDFSKVANGRWQTTNFSYPLELTAKMNGWQPPVKKLILNSYLDEIPYKLENTLWATTRQINNRRLELCHSNCPLGFAPSPGISFRSHPCSARRTHTCTFGASEEANGDVKKGVKTLIKSPKKVDKGVKGETPLMKEKLQLIGIKQLLKNELQILVNSLPVTFVNRSSRAESNNQTNNVESYIRDAQKTGTWLTPNRKKLDDLCTFDAEQMGLNQSNSPVAPPLHPPVRTEAMSSSKMCCTCNIRDVTCALHGLNSNSNSQIANNSNSRSELRPSIASNSRSELELELELDRHKEEKSTQQKISPTSPFVDREKNNVFDGPDTEESGLLPSASPMQNPYATLSQTKKRAEEMHLVDSFFLLNSLGITFNNLSCLKDPPVLLPMNQDASFWKWNRKKVGSSLNRVTHVTSPMLQTHAQCTQCTEGAKKMEEGHGAPKVQRRWKKVQVKKRITSPIQRSVGVAQRYFKKFGLNSLAKEDNYNTVTDTTFRFQPKTMTWQVLQQLNCGQSFENAKTPLVNKREEKKHLIQKPTRSRAEAMHKKRVHFINQIILKQKKTRFFTPSFNPLQDSNSQIAPTFHYSRSGPIDSKRDAHVTSPSSIFDGDNAQCTIPVQNKKSHLLLPSPMVTYGAPNSPLHFGSYASPQPLRESEFIKIDNINPVDTQISLTNKRVRLMSGYIYPDTQSASLMPNLYRWTYSAFPFGGTPNIASVLIGDVTCASISPDANKVVASSHFLKKPHLLSTDGDKNLTPSIPDCLLYSKMFRGINRLVDKACLFKVCTSGAPTTIGRVASFSSNRCYLSDSAKRRDTSGEKADNLVSAQTEKAIEKRIHWSGLKADRVDQWNFEHHLGYYPGFIKPNQFIGSINQLTQGNNLSEDLFTHFYEVSLNSNNSGKKHGIINSVEGVHGRKQNLTQNKKGPRSESSQPFDCSPRKTAYNGIVVQRNPFTKDFQLSKTKFERDSILGTFLFGPENPFTDRQSHFFGQRRLSTVDVNGFQRDYLRQLGKETLLQSNPKGFTYGASVERVKILSFSKAINSFLSKKRKYTYLLEEKDQWHLLFQEQLRTALEDSRKYPPLTPEESKDHGPGRIKVSAPLMMARFPKRSNCYKVLAHSNSLHSQIASNSNSNSLLASNSRSELELELPDKSSTPFHSQSGHNAPQFLKRAEEKNAKVAEEKKDASAHGHRDLHSPIDMHPSNHRFTSFHLVDSTPSLHLPVSAETEMSCTPCIVFRSHPCYAQRTHTCNIEDVTSEEADNIFATHAQCTPSKMEEGAKVQVKKMHHVTRGAKKKENLQLPPSVYIFDVHLLPSSRVPHAIFTETWSESFNSAPLLDKSLFAFGNNNLSVFLGQQWLTQEPLNANSWLIISQWSFLVALLFWIEQTFLADIFPALFALEQLLLGTTGMKSDDRTHVTRVSKGEIPKFKDIAGIDGLLGELAELVLFLRGHKKRLWNKKSSYGVLLTGPPGTGKTFLVRALANEAKVPVLILSAGVLTANKTNNSKPSWSIRHAFRRAKQLAPCILFIDEIDALGRSRGNIVTDINEIVADAKGGQNVQATPLSNSNFFEMKNSFQFHLPSVQRSYNEKATLANMSLQHQLLSATETQVHQIQGTKSLRELASQGKSTSAYNQIDRYSLCADTSWLTNAFPFGHKSPTLGSETKIPSRGDKNLSTGSYAHASYQPVQSMQTKENIKRKFGPLTQLLVSMDGVSSLAGVLIIGATNRPESLDPALTRPGRFERIIRVEKPAEQKRIEILKLYSRNLGIQKQIPWSYLANRTMGLTAADLAVAMNYSSLKAILQGTMHTIETIEYGLDSIARFSNGKRQQKQLVINKKSTENPLLHQRCEPKMNVVSWGHSCTLVPSSLHAQCTRCTEGAKKMEEGAKVQATNTEGARSEFEQGKPPAPTPLVESQLGVRSEEKVDNVNFFPYSLDVAFLATCKEQRLTKSLDFLLTPSVLNSQIALGSTPDQPTHAQCTRCTEGAKKMEEGAKVQVKKLRRSVSPPVGRASLSGPILECIASALHDGPSQVDNLELKDPHFWESIDVPQLLPFLFFNVGLKRCYKYINTIKENYDRYKAQWVYKSAAYRQCNRSICTNRCLHSRGTEEVQGVNSHSRSELRPISRSIVTTRNCISDAHAIKKRCNAMHDARCTMHGSGGKSCKCNIPSVQMKSVADGCTQAEANNMEDVTRACTSAKSKMKSLLEREKVQTSASTSDFFSFTTKTKKIEKKRLQRLTQIAYYQSGKIVVQTLLPLHPPVALITLNLSGVTTATSADTYIPIDGELNTYWCSFLESRLMGLYGGKASSLLLNRQHLLSIFSEQPKYKDGISNALSSDKPYNDSNSNSRIASNSNSRSELRPSSELELELDSPLSCFASSSLAPKVHVLHSGSTKRFTRFAIDPLGRSKIHFTASAKKQQQRLDTEGVINPFHRGNLFQSNIGTEEIQTATFLAASMVNRWALSYSYTFGADSLNLPNRENYKTGDNSNAPFYKLRWGNNLVNKIGDYPKPENLIPSVSNSLVECNTCTFGKSEEDAKHECSELSVPQAKDTNLMNTLFSTFEGLRRCNKLNEKKAFALAPVERASLQPSQVHSKRDALRTDDSNSNSQIASNSQSELELDMLHVQNVLRAKRTPLGVENTVVDKGNQCQPFYPDLLHNKINYVTTCQFYIDYLHSISNDSEERYHSSLENNRPLLFTRATFFKEKNNSNKKGTKLPPHVTSSMLQLEKRTRTFESISYNNSSVPQRHLATLSSPPNSALHSTPIEPTRSHQREARHATHAQCTWCTEGAKKMEEGAKVQVKKMQPQVVSMHRRNEMVRGDEQSEADYISDVTDLSTCIEEKSEADIAGVLDLGRKVTKMASKKFSGLKRCDRSGSFTTSLISKADTKNCTYFPALQRALSYSPGRVSIKNVALTIPLRTHVFQLVNPLQLSISQRDRFYPGWFRLYLPDIEATEFLKNVANYYYSQGLQTLTRASSIFDRMGAVDTENPIFLVSSFSKKKEKNQRQNIIKQMSFSQELKRCTSTSLHKKTSEASEATSSLGCNTCTFSASEEDAGQKLPFDYNDVFFLEKELIYHSLVNNCFSKAFFLIDQNRQLTDYFADYLVRFQILRQHQILYLFSTVLFSCKKQT